MTVTLIHHRDFPLSVDYSNPPVSFTIVGSRALDIASADSDLDITVGFEELPTPAALLIAAELYFTTLARSRRRPVEGMALEVTRASPPDSKYDYPRLHIVLHGVESYVQQPLTFAALPVEEATLIAREYAIARDLCDCCSAFKTVARQLHGAPRYAWLNIRRQQGRPVWSTLEDRVLPQALEAWHAAHGLYHNQHN